MLFYFTVYLMLNDINYFAVEGTFTSIFTLKGLQKICFIELIQTLFFLFSFSSLSVTNYFLLFIHLFSLCRFLVSYKLFMILLIDLCSVLCPVLFLFGVRLGSLPLVLFAGSFGGCVH
jgi:hypothetical protein